jgi:hypothetical protein
MGNGTSTAILALTYVNALHSHELNNSARLVADSTLRIAWLSLIAASLALLQGREFPVRRNAQKLLKNFVRQKPSPGRQADKAIGKGQ